MSVRFRNITWFVLALTLGCGEDDSQSTSTRTDTTSYVRVLSVSPIQGSLEPPVLPCDGRLLVRAETNWRISPPGTCGGTRQCGHLVVRATGATDEVRVRTATGTCSGTCSTTALLELSPLEAWVGPVTLEAAISLDNGTPYVKPDGELVRDSVTLELSSPVDCGDAEDPGAGAGGSNGSE